jgi:drug/metabolite transporter (DMT)-like permease
VRKLHFDLALLLVTLLWGCAFVAQRLGMDYLGPFTFNAFRFALGGLIVWVFAWFAPRSIMGPLEPNVSALPRPHIWHGIRLGCLLFLGAALQQAGLVSTSAGKAGFLTVLYVVFVPILSSFFGYKVFRSEVVGAGIALIGSYYLSITEGFVIEGGDILVTLGAVTWAFHAIAVSKGTEHIHPLVLAYQQFFTCALLSFVTAVLFETFTIAQVSNALPAILYTGGVSIAVGYTMQVVVQRFVTPSHAVIIFSLEGVFAAAAGWFFLGEMFSLRSFYGALLMLVGVLVAQYSRVVSPTAVIDAQDGR